jgi:hypothetical protein
MAFCHCRIALVSVGSLALRQITPWSPQDQFFPHFCYCRIHWNIGTVSFYSEVRNNFILRHKKTSFWMYIIWINTNDIYGQNVGIFKLVHLYQIISDCGGMFNTALLTCNLGNGQVCLKSTSGNASESGGFLLSHCIIPIFEFTT